MIKGGLIRLGGCEEEGWFFRAIPDTTSGTDLLASPKVNKTGSSFIRSD
jgi:hypothetical protein